MVCRPEEKSDRGCGLILRIATEDDYLVLREMRIECGWGLPKLEKRIHNPDWIFCVFSKDIEGVPRDVGMGGWCFAEPYDGVLPDEENLASRSERIVFLTSLFIRPKYQRLGLGGTAMDLLEQTAKNVHGAEYVTLDTVKYYCDESHEVLIEDKTRSSKTVPWYKARGYTEFRELVPLFPHPLPDNPDYKLTATFFKKRL